MMTDPHKAKAPKYLRPATRRWFEAVVEGWDLEQHHVRLLTLAWEAWEARLADAERELVAVRLAERLQGSRADALEATAREVRVAAIRTSAWWCVAYLLALGVIAALHWPLAISLAAAVAIVSGRREWRRIRRTDRSV